VRRSFANCAAVREMIVVDEPEKLPDVAAGAPVNGTWTAATEPGSAGEWTWAAVAGAERPEKVSVHVDVDVDWSNVKVMVPVAVLAFGGTSSAPTKAPVHWITSPDAWAD